ncbi:MAG: hypothetical protein QMB63_03505 [Clostridiaceae bacterium]
MSEDTILKLIEGRWYLQYSGSPLWSKEDVSKVTFNYKLLHRGETLVLEDKVEYMKNGKMRFRLGYDYPVEDIPMTFKWKGVGVNRFYRNRFEVTILTAEYMVMFFEKTITSPTSIDILTRNKTITEEFKNQIFKDISENQTVKEFLGNIEKVTQN